MKITTKQRQATESKKYRSIVCLSQKKRDVTTIICFHCRILAFTGGGVETVATKMIEMN